MSVVRDVATVTVQDAVDGTRHRRGGPQQRRATLTRDVTVHPKIMAAVARIQRPGERLQILSETEVLLVPRRGSR